MALLKFLKKKSNKSNERTTAYAYTVKLKVDLYSITKTLISSSTQDFYLASHTWKSVSPVSIAITNTSVAFVKFTVINPNAFPIFIDDWKIEEKGKVILQENHYDPYGASLFGIEKTGTHEFLYQGKERNEELGLNWDDFEWRNYDITYFRTTTIDPHAENYYSLSPYSWVAGNPIMFIDPDGRDWIINYDEKTNHYTFAFRGQIINETGKEIKDLDKIASELLTGLAEIFNDGKGEGISWSFDMEKSYLKVANNESDLSATDHAVRIVKAGTVIAGERIDGGKAGFGSQSIYLNESILENREPMKAGKDEQSKNWNARGLTKNGQLIAKYIFAHEAIHTAYLPHITMPKKVVGKDYIPASYFANYETGNPYTSGKNIMSDYKHSLGLVAPVITPRQIQVINRRYNAGMLNNGLQRIGKNNPFISEY